VLSVLSPVKIDEAAVTEDEAEVRVMLAPGPVSLAQGVQVTVLVIVKVVKARSSNEMIF
jgi:hypothetical protein